MLSIGQGRFNFKFEISNMTWLVVAPRTTKTQSECSATRLLVLVKKSQKAGYIKTVY